MYYINVFSTFSIGKVWGNLGGSSKTLLAYYKSLGERASRYTRDENIHFFPLKKCYELNLICNTISYISFSNELYIMRYPRIIKLRIRKTNSESKAPRKLWLWRIPRVNYWLNDRESESKSRIHEIWTRKVSVKYV